MTPPPPTKDRPPKHRLVGPRAATDSVAAGASLSVAWRWTDRLLSLVSMPILARVLTPEDFGLVAMAMIVVGLIDVLLDLGVNIALVQNRDATVEHFDTAWTLRLAQGLIVGVLVAGASWPASTYFGDPRLVAVMQVVALTSALSGLENIGVVMLQRNFEFAREFRFFLWRRAFSFVVTIGLALALGSYWALVLGALGGRIGSIALSYLVHDFRPRISLVRLREILSISQWLLLRGIGAYVLTKIDQIVLGRAAGTSQVGAYSVGAELAAMPATELLAPLSRVLFPTFVAAQTERVALARALRLGLSVQALVAIPAGIGLALVADDAVHVVLGSQWKAAIPVVELLALTSVLSPLGYTSNYALLAEGRVKLLTAFILIQIGLFAAICASGLRELDATGVAFARLAASALMTLLVAFVWLRPPLPLDWRGVLACVWRPVLASAVMVGAVTASGLIGFAGPYTALAGKILTGSITYAITLYALWLHSGQPDDGESYLLGKIGPAAIRVRAGLRRVRGRPET